MANAELYGEVLKSVVVEENCECMGANKLNSEEAIDRLRSVAGVEVVRHLNQVEGATKARLRFESFESVDVKETAWLFRGGGHRLAAGYTTLKSPEEVREELLAALR